MKTQEKKTIELTDIELDEVIMAIKTFIGEDGLQGVAYPVLERILAELKAVRG